MHSQKITSNPTRDIHNFLYARRCCFAGFEALRGDMASVASHERRSSALGHHIMAPGLALRSLTLARPTVRLLLSLSHASKNQTHVPTHSKGICIYLHGEILKAPASLTELNYLTKKAPDFLAVLAIATICVSSAPAIVWRNSVKVGLVTLQTTATVLESRRTHGR
jgi:hypothetical protein